MCEDLRHTFEPGSIDLCKPFLCFFTKIYQNIDVPIRDVQASLTARLFVHLKIGHHLFKGKFKRISDVVEERGHSPELQKQVRGFSRLLQIVLIRIDPVEFLKFLSVMDIGLVDRKPERKNIDGM